MKKISSFSITTQLTLALIGAVVASLLMIGSILSYISLQAQLNQLQLTQQAQAQVVSEKINAYIDDLQRKLAYLARVRGLTTFDATTQRDLLDGLIHHNQAYQSVGLTDAHGHLQQFLSPFGETAPQEWGATTLFRRTFQEQEDFIGLVELAPQHTWPTLILAVPIRDRENQVAGMLFARINLKFLWAVLEETIVGQSGYVYVVDQRQFVIAQSGNLPTQFAFVDLSQSPLSQVFTSSSTTATQRYQGLRQIEVLGNVANISSTHWRVVVELPVSEAYAPMFKLLAIMLAGLTLGVIMAGGLGLWLAQQVTQPLQRLTRAAISLSHGELQTHVIMTQENELKILADAFNDMAAQLRSTITHLQLDITKRKQVEGALRASEEKSRIVFATLPVGVSVIDNKGQLVDCNDALTQILRLSRQELFQNNYAHRHYLRVDGSPMPRSEFASSRALTEQRPIFNVEVGFVAENQKEVWLSVNAAPLPIADLAVVVVTSDITVHKQHEAEIKKLNADLKRLLTKRTAQLQEEILEHRHSKDTLQESENRFRVAQDISLEAFTILRAIRNEQQQIIDFEWTYANPVAGQILQAPPEKLVGQRLLEVLPGNRENQALFNRYVRIAEEGQGDEIELEYESEGVRGWFRNMTVRLSDGIAISFSDITKRKQAEVVLREHKAELERLVEARTAELLATNAHLMQEIVDHQKTMNTLRESEASLRESQRVAHVGHWTWDTVKNEVIWSDEMKRIFGLDPTTFNGDLDKIITEAIHPADREKVITANTLVVQEQKPTPLEYRVIHPDQSVRTVWAEPGNRVTDKQGHILKLMGIVQDITERKQTEESLLKSEQRFRTVLEAVSEAIVIIDTTGHIVMANAKTSQLFNYQKAELLGQPIELLLPQRYQNIHHQHRDGYFADPRTRSMVKGLDLVGCRKDGSEFPIEVGLSYVEIDMGVVAIGFITDITERKQVQDNLNKLSRAVEQSNSSIVITDLAGNIEFVNHAFSQTTGYTFEESMGQNPRILKSGHQAAEFYQELWHTLQSSGDWRGELLNKKKNGELYWELAHISAIKNSQGQVTHYVAVKDDITERKETELQIQMTNQRLMQAYDETLEGWARALDLRDKETEGHSRRVTEMTVELAQHLGFEESQLIHLRWGALLHDIGKVGIPDGILLKPGPLDDAERRVMELHPVYAYQMLQPISYLQPALDISYCHHEKWDGTGYPRGLKGEEIPLPARLFAVVDVWDALRSNRPYRAAWSKEKTIDYILAQSGTHFDPQVVPLFLETVGGRE